MQCIAGMSYEDNRREEKALLDWEKVNALEHLRKHNIAEHEKLDSRVGVIDSRVMVIEDRCL